VHAYVSKQALETAEALTGCQGASYCSFSWGTASASSTTASIATTSSTAATSSVSASATLLHGALLGVSLELLSESSEGRGNRLNLGPEIGGEVSVGLSKGIEDGLDEVLGSSGVTGGGGVNIIDSSELEELLGDGGSDNTGSSGSGYELASDGSGFTVDLGGDGMDVSDLVTPVTSSDGDESELGGDEGTLNGDLDFLGNLDTETDVTVVITDGNDSLEAGTLSGLGLLLDGDDLHDLILELLFAFGSLVLLGDKGLNDLSLLDWDGVSVDLFEGRDVVVLDESSEFGLGGPLFLSGATAATGTTSTASSSSESSSLLSFNFRCFSHLILGY